MYLKLWSWIKTRALSVMNLNSKTTVKPSCSKKTIKYILRLHHSTNGLAEHAVQIVNQGLTLKKDKNGSMKRRLAKVIIAYRVSPQNR